MTAKVWKSPASLLFALAVATACSSNPAEAPQSAPPTDTAPQPAPAPPSAPAPRAPAAPLNLNATASSVSSILLAWTDASDDEAQFQVERSSGSATTGFVRIANLAANSSSYADSGLSPASTYWYRVRAGNSAGDSEYSNVATARTFTPNVWDQMVWDVGVWQ
jgi:hypothetical protein